MFDICKLSELAAL